MGGYREDIEGLRINVGEEWIFERITIEKVRIVIEHKSRDELLPNLRI